MTHHQPSTQQQPVLQTPSSLTSGGGGGVATGSGIVLTPPSQYLAAANDNDGGQVLKLPGGGRLYEPGEFMKILKNARRDFRAYLRSELSAQKDGSNSVPSSSSPVTTIPFAPPQITIPMTPPNWQNYHDELVRTASQYESFPVDPHSFEYRKLVEMIEPYTVVSINKIVNRLVWNLYVTRRNQLLRQKSEDPNVWRTLNMSSVEVDGRIKRDKEFRDKNPTLSIAKGNYDLNEALLFHCTRNKENVEPILKEGLDERLGTDAANVLMGKGIYFSDHVKKSRVYIGDSRTVMLFTVILGDCKDMDEGGTAAKELIKEPEKTPEEKRNDDDISFDSITGRPNYPPYNEFVIFDRNQCCPMYEVVLKQKSINSPVVETAPGHEHFEAARADSPDFVWKEQDQMTHYLPNPQNAIKEWPFFISTLFKKMDLSANLESLKKTGFLDEDVNAYVLSELDNNLDEAVTFLQDVINHIMQMPEDEVNQNQPIVKKRKRGSSSKATPTAVSSSSSSAPPPSPFATLNLRKPIVCRSCKEKYGSRSYVVLKCNHQVCSVCWPKLRKVGDTMKSKISHTWIKCPICYEVDGVEIGTCPQGVMTVTRIPTLHCDGHKKAATIEIVYTVWHNGEKDERTAYIPDINKGRKLENLLKIAWDRKLILSIGESVSRGLTDVPIWNIEHKTNLTGGEENFGYPDETYLDRTLDYLKIYHLK